MKMRWIQITMGCFSILLALFTGWESYEIAHMGVLMTNAQLEGDGGGGLVFAIVCFFAAIVLFYKPLWSTILYFISAIFVILVGVFYQDMSMLIWSALAVVFMGSSIYLTILDRKMSVKG